MLTPSGPALDGNESAVLQGLNCLIYVVGYKI